MKRGHEIFIYPPDTFLKPILIVSRMGKETALLWVSALNSHHVLGAGLEHFRDRKEGSEYNVIGTDTLYSSIVKKLKSKSTDWDFYLELYHKYCPKEMRKEY